MEPTGRKDAKVRDNGTASDAAVFFIYKTGLFWSAVGPRVRCIVRSVNNWEASDSEFTFLKTAVPQDAFLRPINQEQKEIRLNEICGGILSALNRLDQLLIE